MPCTRQSEHTILPRALVLALPGALVLALPRDLVLALPRALVLALPTCGRWLWGLQVGGGPTQRSITADEMTRVSSCVKIQRAWRLYKPEHICSICLSGIDKEKNNCVTECGHKFCFTCLVSNLPHRQTCPLCRAPLVPDFVKNLDEQDIIDSYQTGYGRGLMAGRAIKEDELDDAKAEITRLKYHVSRLRCDHDKQRITNLFLRASQEGSLCDIKNDIKNDL